MLYSATLCNSFILQFWLLAIVIVSLSTSFVDSHDTSQSTDRESVLKSSHYYSALMNQCVVTPNCTDKLPIAGGGSVVHPESNQYLN